MMSSSHERERQPVVPPAAADIPRRMVARVPNQTAPATNGQPSGHTHHHHPAVREIHKNAWLKRLTANEKKGTPFVKKCDKFWVVFCVHDDVEAYLEFYTEPKMGATHKPLSAISLNGCLHVSPTLIGQDNEYQFAVTLQSQVIRLLAANWDQMIEWVESLQGKLREMNILSPKDNLYSKLPENRNTNYPFLAPTIAYGIVSTRDPNSPLPPTPNGFVSPVLGTEVSLFPTAFNRGDSVGSDNSGSSNSCGRGISENSGHEAQQDRRASTSPVQFQNRSQNSSETNTPPTTSESHYNSTWGGDVVTISGPIVEPSTSSSSHVYIHPPTILTCSSSREASSNSDSGANMDYSKISVPPTALRRNPGTVCVNVKLNVNTNSISNNGSSSSSPHSADSSSSPGVSLISMTSGVVVKNNSATTTVVRVGISGEGENKCAVVPVSSSSINSSSTSAFVDPSAGQYVESTAISLNSTTNPSCTVKSTSGRHSSSSSGGNSSTSTSSNVIVRNNHENSTTHVSTVVTTSSNSAPRQLCIQCPVLQIPSKSNSNVPVSVGVAAALNIDRPSSVTSQLQPQQRSSSSENIYEHLFVPEQPLPANKSYSRSKTIVGTTTSRNSSNNGPSNTPTPTERQTNQNNSCHSNNSNAEEQPPVIPRRNPQNRRLQKGNHISNSARSSSLSRLESPSPSGGRNNEGSPRNQESSQTSSTVVQQSNGYHHQSRTQRDRANRQDIIRHFRERPAFREIPSQFPVLQGRPLEAMIGVRSGEYRIRRDESNVTVGGGGGTGNAVVPHEGDASSIPPVPQPAASTVNQAQIINGPTHIPLKEQQVMRLRMEISHPGGVRVVLRKKDCVNSIAFVDFLGAVWIAGWKQQQHPVLYYAFHVGDQILKVAGVTVQTSLEANRAIKMVSSMQVEFIIRRLPFGRVLVLRRTKEGEPLGLIAEGNSGEIGDVDPCGLAASHGLPRKGPSTDGHSSCNWFLTEINNRPLSLLARENEVKDRLNAVGKEISILVQPADLVKHLKKNLKSLKGFKDYLVV